MELMNPASTLNYRQIRSVALPSEHGSWSFLFEPLLLGLLVAGSPKGWLLAAAMLCAFLIHQPLKLALKDRLKGRRSPRTAWAERFAAGYGALALLLLALVGIKSDPRFVLPLLLGLPFLLVQVRYDARNRSRALLPELCGTVALGSAASAVAMLGGWSFGAALPLWLLMVSRSIPSILYVRARLRLEHGKSVSPYSAWGAHVAALLIVALLAAVNIVPVAVIGAWALLLARAVIGLSSRRRARPAKVIGLLDVAYGLILVAMAAVGYTAGV
jgi:hypothetical protein